MNRRIFLILTILPVIASSETLVGHVTKVRDGDTIEVSAVPIRLQGVAAPELKEKWGRASKKAMQRLVAGQRLRCELTGKKTHDREVGVCYLDDGTDIGATIITEGLARDCPRYSGERYGVTRLRRVELCLSQDTVGEDKPVQIPKERSSVRSISKRQE